MLQSTGKGHCFVCHEDFDNNVTVTNHQCSGTPTPGGCSNCKEWENKFPKRNCPHCGKEL